MNDDRYNNFKCNNLIIFNIFQIKIVIIMQIQSDFWWKRKYFNIIFSSKIQWRTLKKRFNEFKEGKPNLSNKVLSNCLKEMEENGLITRKTNGGIEYKLTDPRSKPTLSGSIYFIILKEYLHLLLNVR